MNTNVKTASVENYYSRKNKKVKTFSFTTNTREKLNSTAFLCKFLLNVSDMTRQQEFYRTKLEEHIHTDSIP